MTLGYKDKEIRKSDFVAKNQLLWHQIDGYHNMNIV